MSAGTGVRGVYTHPDGGFTASIGVRGKRIYLGWFRTIEEAQVARRAAEVTHFGAHERRMEIDVRGDIARVPLHGHHGVLKGQAFADAALIARFGVGK